MGFYQAEATELDLTPMALMAGGLVSRRVLLLSHFESTTSLIESAEWANRMTFTV
jgi:hypothetical protein